MGKAVENKKTEVKRVVVRAECVVWGLGRGKMSEITFCVWEKRSQLECAATR